MIEEGYIPRRYVNIEEDAPTVEPAVAAGSKHAVALKSDGTVWKWGLDASGQAMCGYSSCSTSPVPVSITNVVSISGNGKWAVKADGTLWFGIYDPPPVQKWGGNDWVAVEHGNNGVIALKDNGTVWRGSVNDPSPSQVGVSSVEAVAAGYGHYLALQSNGTLWAWGANDQGQIGDGTQVWRDTPVQVATNVVAVAAGGWHTIALKSNGTVWTWGDNFHGQLGDSTTTNSSSPVQAWIYDVVSVSAGRFYNTAIKSDGTAWAWGRNDYGNLGVGTFTGPEFCDVTWNCATVPVQIGTDDDWLFIDCGDLDTHTVALKTDRTVWAWGDNYYGQLGDGTRLSSSSPVEVMVAAEQSISVSSTELNFGDVNKGETSLPKILSLTNIGIANLTVTSITNSSGAFNVSRVGPEPCPAEPFTLEPGKGCTVTVNFSPTALGVQISNVVISYGLPGNTPINIMLIGNGVAPNLAVDPASLDFGAIIINGTSAPSGLTLSNTGTAVLNVSSSVTIGTDAAMFNAVAGGASPCPAYPFSLNPGAGCTLDVAFSPTSAGIKSAALQVSSNDPDTPALEIPLGGNGAVLPKIAADMDSIDFSEVLLGMLSDTQTLTLSNDGFVLLTVTHSDVTGPDAAMFSVASAGSAPCFNSPALLEPGEQCTLECTFSPTAAGIRSASLNLYSDDPDMPTFVIPLGGTGLELYTLTMNIEGGTGLGNVTSIPPGIDCNWTPAFPFDCTEDYADGTNIELTATPDADSTFIGWSGAGSGCVSGSTNPCSFDIDTNSFITATFDLTGSDVSVVHNMPEKYPAAFPAHGWIRYTVEVTNNGPDTATGVELTDTLPSGAEYIYAESTQGLCNASSGTVSCDIGTMNDSATVTVTIDVIPLITGTALNNAVVSCTSDDQISSNDSDTDSRIIFPSIFTDVDFNGDGTKDIAVYRPSTGWWHVTDANGSFSNSVSFGIAGDIPVPADYRDDSATELAVYRPSNGYWFFRGLTNSTIDSVSSFGIEGDVPVPADYKGDEKTEVAVYRPSNGWWFITDSNKSVVNSVCCFGGQPGDVPIPGDYKGDAKAELAVYRVAAPYTGWWYITDIGKTIINSVQFGIAGDMPVPADYRQIPGVDPDDKVEIAVYRPSNGWWFITDLGKAVINSVSFGIAGDVPMPDDYKGPDSKAELSVLRPSTMSRYFTDIPKSYTDWFQWGTTGDIALSGDYYGTGFANATLFRPSNGTWYITDTQKSFTNSVSHGAAGDIPY